MTTTIRIATVQDAEPILEIYAPIVRETAISFEIEPPTVAEMQQRIEETLTSFPWLVYERQGEVLGYVYASKHRARAAYQWGVDVSVYIHAQARRAGIGRALYTSLFALLERQGFYRGYAGITLPNAASVALHELLGFRPVGVYREVGYKLEAWHDVGWWQLTLRTDSNPPAAPITFPVMRREDTGWQVALAAGLPLLQIEF